MFPETVSIREFVFRDDGSFKQSDVGGSYYEGKWELSANQKELVLQYTTGRTDSIKFGFRKTSEGKLKLTRAGRCGITIETYRATTK